MESDGILVTFLDQTGAKAVKARIAPTVTVKKILPSIITKMTLPMTSPDGQPLSYSLDHKEGGKRLLEDQTLDEQGVKEGEHCIVFPEIVAGATDTFKVAAVTNNRNSFGLRGAVLLTRKGVAYQVGFNDHDPLAVGQVVKVKRKDFGDGIAHDWRPWGVEIPERLPDAPPGVVQEVWK